MDAIQNPTLADLAARMDQNGKPARIIEILKREDGILEDMPFIECNQKTKHVTTLRTKLPKPVARLYNRGTPSTKSDVGSIEESPIMLEDWAQADADLVDKNGEGYRMGEHTAHIQGFNQEVGRMAFYGNSNINPLDEFMGLAPRYNSLTDSELKDYVITGGGSGSNNTSIWLVNWGEDTVHGIYPAGSSAGLSHKDLGKRVKTYDDSGTERNIEVYDDKYAWDIGLVVRDYRSIVRIPNIDVTALKADPTTGGADLYELVSRAQERIPTNGRLAFYGNRKVREFMRLQAQNKKNVQISTSEVTGKRVMDVDGIPFRLSDALVNNEAAVA